MGGKKQSTDKHSDYRHSDYPTVYVVKESEDNNDLWTYKRSSQLLSMF